MGGRKYCDTFNRKTLKIAKNNNRNKCKKKKNEEIEEVDHVSDMAFVFIGGTYRKY